MQLFVRFDSDQLSPFVSLSNLDFYLDEVTCDVTSCDVQPACEVRQRKALIHRTDVRDTIARVDHNTGQQTCRQDRFPKEFSLMFTDESFLEVRRKEMSKVGFLVSYCKERLTHLGCILIYH